MNSEKIYRHIYKLLEDVTPIKADCGELCQGACCEGDGETGMYLFPFEECMYDGTEDWLEICDSDFIFDDKPVKIAICDGTCDRKKRPLSCRIFPLFLLNGKVVPDTRANHLCPLVKAKISLEEYDPQFIENVTKVFNILSKFKTTREYIKATQKIINEFEDVNNLFAK